MEENTIETINNFIPNPQEQNNQRMFSKEYILNAFKDQNETKYLQKQLRIISAEEIDYIIDQLKVHSENL